MQLTPEELLRMYKRAMLNIHSALLLNFGGKGFYGFKVHAAVTISGISQLGRDFVVADG